MGGASNLLPALGRILYAATILGFGVLCWVYGDFVHQLQPVAMFVPATSPAYGVLSIFDGVVLIVAGLMILGNVEVRRSAIAVAGLFALSILVLQVPSAFLDPSLLRSPWWIRTFELVALIGAAVILASRGGRYPNARWNRVGRVLFGISLPVFGVLHLVYPASVASLIPSFYPWPSGLAYVTGITKIVGGVAIAVGVLSRPAALLIALQYALYALTLHIPRQFVDQPEGYQPAGVTSLFIAMGFWGAALIVVGNVPSSFRTPNSSRDDVVATRG